MNCAQQPIRLHNPSSFLQFYGNYEATEEISMTDAIEDLTGGVSYVREMDTEEVSVNENICVCSA